LPKGEEKPPFTNNKTKKCGFPGKKRHFNPQAIKREIKHVPLKKTHAFEGEKKAMPQLFTGGGQEINKQYWHKQRRSQAAPMLAL